MRSACVAHDLAASIHASARRWRTTGSSVTPVARASVGDLVPARARTPSCWPSVDAPRSNASVPIATFQPPFDLADDVGRPRCGRRRRTTSLNSECPVICTIGRISMPGWSIGTSRYEMPLCLRRVAVGAGEHEAPVRPVRERRPHLLAGDHPLVAVELGAGLHVGEVGAGVRARSSPGTRARCRSGCRAGSGACCSSVPKCTIVGPSSPSPMMPDPARSAGARVLLVEDHLLEQRRAAAAVLASASRGRSSRRAELAAPTRSRSSNSACSSPGPPRPRTPRNSPSSAGRASRAPRRGTPRARR